MDEWMYEKKRRDLRVPSFYGIESVMTFELEDIIYWIKHLN